MKNKTIFISGKITGEDCYLGKFKRAELLLKLQGYKHVINPAELFEKDKDLNWSTYMNVCLKLIEACDCIYMLNDYEDSIGSKMELGKALELDLEIIYEEKITDKFAGYEFTNAFRINDVFIERLYTRSNK